MLDCDRVEMIRADLRKPEHVSLNLDILLRVNTEESCVLKRSGLQSHRTPVRCESVWDSRTVAGGTAGRATPPVLRSTVVFGLPKLCLLWGVRQTSTDSE